MGSSPKIIPYDLNIRDQTMKLITSLEKQEKHQESKENSTSDTDSRY